MDFLIALTESSVQISIGVSVLCGVFSTQLSELGKVFERTLTGSSQYLAKHLRAYRWRNRKRTLQLLANRHAMHWEIVRSYALFLAFFISFSIYLVLLLFGPLKGIGVFPLEVQFFLFSPVLVLEVLWINQKDRTRVLIAQAQKQNSKNKRRKLKCI